MSVFRSLLGREERTIVTAAQPLGEWAGDLYGGTFSGATVNRDTAMQLATVWGCVKFICDGISTLPVDTFREVAGIPEDVTAPPWLYQPTADLDRISWLSQILSSLLISGNAFLRKRRNGVTLTELIPLDPTLVTVRREAGRKVFIVGGATYTSFDVLHIPGIMMPGALVGLAPLEAARQTIGTGLASEEHAARFFGQGLTMSGVIENPGDMTDSNAKAMANSFARRHGGKKNAHLPGVLVGGATWKPTSVTAEQAQFLQTRKFTDAVIAGRIFLVDPTELGIPLDGTTLTYQNAVDRNTRKAEVTFLPWIMRLEMALSSLLPAPRYIKFDLDALKRGDTATRYKTYATGIGAGFLTVDEAREEEDLPPLGTPEVPEPPDPVGDPAED